jgi:hypothetical protein
MEMENSAQPKLSNENAPSPEPARIESLVMKLARFYSVMGNRPDEPGALSLMAEVLCQSASDEHIAHAMTRCCRECRYPVRLSDFLQRIPGQEIPQPEAEGRKAWDILQAFVRKYVGNSIHGEYAPEHGWYPKTFPKLADRVLDTVRRTGGWKIYKCMTDADFPYVQKRFFEEYAAWTAVERVNPDHMLSAVVESKLLTAAPAIPAQIKPVEQPRTFEAKAVPQPLTDAQLRERREMLAQQATALHQRRVQRHTAHSANPNSESESSAPLRTQEQAHA